MKFESNILFSVAVHVAFIAAALFLLGRDAVYRVPERYVQVTLLDHGDNVKAAPAGRGKAAVRILPARGATALRLKSGPRRIRRNSTEKTTYTADKKAVARTTVPLAKKQPEKPKASSVEMPEDRTTAVRNPALPIAEGADYHVRRTAGISGAAGAKLSGGPPTSGIAATTAGTGPSNPSGGGRGKNSGAGPEGRIGEKGNYNVISEIRAAIERAKRYPLFARDRGIEGKVTAEFSIDTNGLPEDVRIKRSSGSKILDSAAKETIIRAAPFPVIRGKIEIPITFRLKQEE